MDLAVRHYREITPVAERTATEIWNVMTKAEERMIKSIRTRAFEKYISVAHPKNGDDFFHEVAFCYFHIFSILHVTFFCGLSWFHFFLDVHRLTVTLMSSLRPTWQLKSCKKLSHVRSRLPSKPNGFIGGTPHFVRGWRTNFQSKSLWGRGLWTTGFTRPHSGLRYIHHFASFI